MNTHRMTLTATLALAVLLGVATQMFAKPNVVLIVCDDLNDYVTGMGGHPQAQHAEHREAGQVRRELPTGLQQHPICAPSRSSFMTGIYRAHLPQHALRATGSRTECWPNSMTAQRVLPRQRLPRRRIRQAHAPRPCGLVERVQAQGRTTGRSSTTASSASAIPRYPSRSAASARSTAPSLRCPTCRTARTPAATRAGSTARGERSSQCATTAPHDRDPDARRAQRRLGGRTHRPVCRAVRRQAVLPGRGFHPPAHTAARAQAVLRHVSHRNPQAAGHQARRRRGHHYADVFRSGDQGPASTSAC